jgi:hypothetical protein
MIALLIVSVFFGAVAACASGVGFIGPVVGALTFVCGLPFALVISLIHGEISYAQDRADCRQTMSEIKAEELADEHEFAEDARLDQLVAAVKKTPTGIYNDNRQVRLYRVHP